MAFRKYATVPGRPCEPIPHETRPIRKLGFRRWYERQLYVSFAWLTTCLLSGVVVGTILEFVGLGSEFVVLMLTLLLVYVVGIMGFTAWRRFWAILSYAQHCANGATCPQCSAYGLFDVPVELEGQIPAHCRKCDYRWTIQ